MKSLKTYDSKGHAAFVYTRDGIRGFTENYDEEVRALISTTICGDLMSGKAFYKLVDCGAIIDYDGILGHVFVNGYDSNLGLHHEGLSQGGFRVDGDTWLGLCDDYDIEVEWCNK